MAVTDRGTKAEVEDAHGFISIVRSVSSPELEALYMHVHGECTSVAFGTNYLYIAVLKISPVVPLVRS